jgi:hypothetical protein
MRMSTCHLCRRQAPSLQRHHLVPRKLLNSENPRQYLVKYEENSTGRALLCVDCDKMVHALHKLKELARKYDTVEKLRRSPKLQKYLAWVSSRPIGVVKHPKRAWEGGKYE